ncbi:hypothetical protein [Novipirellula aureliae]|nr:hypothetical protein [Novipirellula aureliae]
MTNHFFDFGANAIACRFGITNHRRLARTAFAGLLLVVLFQVSPVSARSAPIEGDVANSTSVESESVESESESKLQDVEGSDSTGLGPTALGPVRTETDKISELPTHLAFAATRFDDLREGYVELHWNPVESATEYVVIEDNGSQPYRGSFEQAFISGLSNGKHAFIVEAYDSAGNLLATSAKPAIVTVDHWPLSQAMIVFTIGLVIFVALISIIAHGALTADKKSAAIPAGESERPG